MRAATVPADVAAVLRHHRDPPALDHPQARRNVDQRVRHNLGIRVIAFLLVFLVIAFMLKKEIWKDVH